MSDERPHSDGDDERGDAVPSRRPDRSSRSLKTDVEPVDECSVLQTVRSLEITEWCYEGDPEHVRHLGPMAEEFHDAFGLGVDDEHIAPLDSAGVALVVIQGLVTVIDHCEARLEELERERDHLYERVGNLENAIAEPDDTTRFRSDSER